MIDKDILNSAGNHCLQLIGNLNTYRGAELGGSGYIRNRPEEFSLKGVPRDELISMVDKIIVVLDEMVSTQHLLVHLCTHDSYHLGQIN